MLFSISDHVLALCIAEESKDDSEIRTWINELQKNHPRLAQLNVIFNIHSSDNS